MEKVRFPLRTKSASSDVWRRKNILLQIFQSEPEGRIHALYAGDLQRILDYSPGVLAQTKMKQRVGAKGAYCGQQWTREVARKSCPNNERLSHGYYVQFASIIVSR